MYTRRLLVLGLLAAGFVLGQDAPPTVQVTGAVKQTLSLSADDLAKMPRATVRTTSNGMETVYEGYQVVFSLGELDPSFIDNEVLLADTANGKPLFGAQGRFRLVVPKDKPGARSVRMLIKIEVVQLRK